MTVRLVMALTGDVILALVVPLPLSAWVLFSWWLPGVCDAPDAAGPGCEGPLFMLVFVYVPLLTLATGALYSGLSAWRGRTPMMVLFRVPGLRARSEARRPAARERRGVETHTETVPRP